MNVPNRLTISRLLLTGAFVLILSVGMPFAYTTSLVLFIIAAFTDFFDGRIARKNKIVTDFGILMDPLADKVLTCAAFILFAELGCMPAWMVVVVVAREIGITGLRMLAAAKNRILPAEKLGKYKTTAQLTCIISIFVQLSVPEWGSIGELIFGLWVDWFVLAAIWIALGLTVLSGGRYLWQNRDLFLHDM